MKPTRGTRLTRLLGSVLLIASLVAVFAPAMVPVGSDSAVAQGFTSYGADKYDCPPGFDPGAGGIGDIFSNCTIYPPGPIDFMVFSQDSNYGGSVQTYSAGGSFGWSDIPAGIGYTVAESIPAGYGDPVVYCEYTFGDGATTSNAFFASGGVMDVGISDPNLAGAVSTSCRWFNIPLAASSTSGFVTLEAWTCDPNDQPDGGMPFDNLLATCQPGPEGRRFAISVDNNPPTEAQLDANGAAQLSDFPGGAVTIVELADPFPTYGFRRVQCALYDAATSSPTNWGEDPNLSGDLIVNSIPAGQSLTCRWLTIPYQGTLMQNYACPTSDIAATLETLLTECTVATGVRFWNEATGGSAAGTTIETPMGFWYAPMRDGPVDSVWIQEPMPGLGQSRLFCRVTHPGSLPQSAEEFSATTEENRAVPGGETLPVAHVHQHTVPQRGQTSCAWFNFPADEATETPTATWTPTSTETASPTWTATSTETASPTWTPTSTTTGTPTWTPTATTTGTPTWTPTSTPTGTPTWTPTWTPTSTTTGTPTWTPTSTTTGTPTWTPTWTATATTTGTPTWTPTSTTTGTPTWTPTSTATATTTGTPTWTPTATTTGTPTWTPTATPTWTVSPTATNTRAAATATATRSWLFSTATATPATVTLLPPGQQPPGAGIVSTPASGEQTTAQLIITLYACPAGFDQYAPGAEVETSCTELTDDVSFTLSAPQDALFQDQVRVTGDDEEGEVAFDELVAGPYVLTQTLPERTGSSFVFSCDSDRRAFFAENPFVPFAFAGPGGELGIVLAAGETLECSWYNVPDPVVSILVFDCPGVVVNTAQCVAAIDPVTLEFTSTGQLGALHEVTTGETGLAEIALEPGSYVLKTTGGTICLVDSEAFDSSGNLVVVGEPVEIRVYTCGR